MPIETYGKVKVDSCGECIKIDPITGEVRVDGALAFKIRTTATGDIFLQFSDVNKYRSELRETRFIEVPMNILMEKIKEACS